MYTYTNMYTVCTMWRYNSLVYGCWVNFIQNKEFFYKDFNTASGPCPIEVFLETYWKLKYNLCLFLSIVAQIKYSIYTFKNL